MGATAVAWQPATRISSRAAPLRMSEQVTDEEEAEIIANAQKIAKKKRSNLYNEDGMGYAPWMVRQVDEDAVAVARAMRGYEKRRERIALEEKQGTINILDAASSELTGLGLKAKVLSEDEVELTWSTDDEEANRASWSAKRLVTATGMKSRPTSRGRPSNPRARWAAPTPTSTRRCPRASGSTESSRSSPTIAARLSVRLESRSRTRASSSRRSWSSAASRRSCWERSRRAGCWTRSRASSILLVVKFSLE